MEAVSLREDDHRQGCFHIVNNNIRPFESRLFDLYKHSIAYITFNGMQPDKNNNIYTHEFIHFTQQYDKESNWYKFAEEKDSIYDPSVYIDDFLCFSKEVHAELGACLLNLHNKIRKLKEEGNGKIDETKLRKHIIKMFSSAIRLSTLPRHKAEGYGETTSILKSFLKGKTKEDLLNFGEKSVEEVKNICDELTYSRLQKLTQPSDRKNKEYEKIDKDFATTRPSRIKLYNEMSHHNYAFSLPPTDTETEKYPTNIAVTKVISELNLGGGEDSIYKELVVATNRYIEQYNKIDNFKDTLKDKSSVTKQEFDNFIREDKKTKENPPAQENPQHPLPVQNNLQHDLRPRRLLTLKERAQRDIATTIAKRNKINERKKEERERQENYSIHI